jgi:putative PIN family toxin of toxin-antitoxin system
MRRLKVVLDTNIVVSANLRCAGYEWFVLDLALAGHFDFYVSPDLLTEYTEVLSRQKIGIPPHQADASLALIRKSAKQVMPSRTLSECRDPDDNRLLECADAVGADYLISGNKRHFPKIWKHTKIVNAREFIELITKDLKKA